MSIQDRQRWDERYAGGEYSERTHPSALLERWLPEFAPGRALDVACGAGRNALHLAAAGFTVDGTDISAVALQRAAHSAGTQGVSVNWLNLDLEDTALPQGPYDLVLVSRFLQHSLVPQILDRLAAGGWLLYEQHLRSDLSDIGGPRSNRFRLRPQELLHLFGELNIAYYYEGLVVDPGGARMALAQLVGRRQG
jgi:tellurite methyltransferase